ncbi:MAG TPA: universal stress protein [Edaphocola sp.]|nr:universal stress protein [Edaphocola sp.]
MTKRLILLIDFSDYSVLLIKYAAVWAKFIGAKILLVHQNVFLTPGLSDIESKAYIIQKTNDEALFKLKSLAFEHIPEQINVEFLVTEDSLQISLNQLIKENYDDLILLGLKGTGFFKQVFIGSMAMQLIEKIENIILALPMNIQKFSLEKINVYVSEGNSVNVIELNNFFRFLNEELTELIFFTVAKTMDNTVELDRNMREIVSLFEGRYKTNYKIYQGNNALQEIKKVISNKKDEILVVQKKNMTFADYFLKTNIMNELVTEGAIPLVILP